MATNIENQVSNLNRKRLASISEPEPIRAIFKRLGYLYPEIKKEYKLKNGLKIKNRKQFIKKSYVKGNVIAYDTETLNGTCKLLCSSDSRQKPLLNPTFKDCLDFLFAYANEKNSYRFFFNIDFDFSSMLKLWNDLPEIEKLKKGIEVQYGYFILKWIKGRMLIIKHITRRKSLIYTDIFNFFHIGLDKASKIYLNDNKIDDIDGNLLNTSLDYWNKRIDDIIKYCIYDCKLTAKLGNLLIDTIQEYGLSLPKCLVSSASLAKQYFRLNSHIPNISHVPEKILQIGYDSYFGGRFEMFKRGYFKEAYLYDINSQYPTFIRDLPNLRDGVWKKTLGIPNRPCLAYYYVEVNIPRDYLIPTVPIHHKGVNKFPAGTIKKWLTWYDIDLIRDYIVKVHKGYRFYPTRKNYKPFKNQIDTLFKQKQALKGKSKMGYNLTKLTMNSLYGCFIETHKNELENGTIDFQAGIMFNSVYASQITAFGRWSVIKEIDKQDYKHVIAIHTDSIIVDKNLDDKLTLNLELGKWNKEASGSCIMINTGMYQIGDVVKTRGIPKRFIGNWLTFCKENQIYIKKTFKIKHMRKISEALVRDKSLENVNIMMDSEKTVNCNSDSKRDWFSNFKSFRDVLNQSITSLPYFCFDNQLDIHPNPICVAYRYDSQL